MIKQTIHVWSWLTASLVLVGITLALFPNSGKTQTASPLEIGIVQRFGADFDDEIRITSPNEAPLTVEIQQEGDSKLLETRQLTLEIETISLSEQKVQEQVVLSNHATFETAEDYAHGWEQLGLPVAITKPGRWQVWAQPEVYDDPIIRRLLLTQLKQQGYQSPYINTQLLEQIPIVSVVVGGKSYTTKQLNIRHPSDKIDVNASDKPRRRYPGQLRVQPNSYGDYTLVNIVPIEEYLRGVVPHEMGSNTPLEAVKAQAIIARTYALRNLHRFRADGYELCANTHCQVYWGLSQTNERSDRAIEQTAQQVLTYQGELVDALYSSTTGGVTAFYTDIWDGSDRPYLRPVVDSTSNAWDLQKYPLDNENNLKRFIEQKQGFNEEHASLFRWEKESDLASLTENLQSYLDRINHPQADAVNEIVEMTITSRSRSGRILEMAVTTDQGVITLEKTEVRSAFDPPRSTLFYLEPMTNEKQELTGYRFIGGGFGHGVGLSQMGARQLAREGWSAQDILSFYYPGTEVIPLDQSE